MNFFVLRYITKVIEEHLVTFFVLQLVSYNAKYNAYSVIRITPFYMILQKVWIQNTWKMQWQKRFNEKQ